MLTLENHVIQYTLIAEYVYITAYNDPSTQAYKSLVEEFTNNLKQQYADYSGNIIFIVLGVFNGSVDIV